MFKVSDKVKYHIKSSAFTFMTGFLPSLAVAFQDVSFETLESAGLIGALLVILRLLLKAGWVGVVTLVGWLASKVKK